MEVENDPRLYEVKKEKVYQTMEIIKSQASDVLLFTLQWKDLDEYLKLAETKVENRLREVKSKEMELHKESFALDQRVAAAEAEMSGLRTEIVDKRKELGFLSHRVDCCVGEFKVEEMRLTQLRTLLEECMVEQRSKTSQLEETVESLRNSQIELEAEMEHLGRTRDRIRVLEEESERKGKELTTVLDTIADSGKQLELVQEQLDSQKKLLETRSCELDCKEKELERLREAERCSGMDLHLREHLLKDTCQQLESKSKELEDIQRLIEERRSHCESLKMLIQEHAEELASKEKKQNELTEAIQNLSLEISSKAKTMERTDAFIGQLSQKLRSKENKLDSTKRQIEKCIARYDSKKKELRSLEDELKSLQPLITKINKQVEEGEKKMHHFDNSNKEILSELLLKKEEVCSINNAIRECSGELESKRRQYDQVQTSITDLTAQLKSKACDLFSIKNKIQESLKDFQSKEEQQARLEASWMEREQKLGVKEKQFDARSEKIELKEKDLDAQEKRIDEKGQELKSREQDLAKCVKDYEQKAKKLVSFLQQGNPDQNVNLLQDASVRDEKTLQLLLQGHLKKFPQLYHDVSCALKTSSDPAKLALDTIHELYSAHQRMAILDRDPNGVRRSIICLLDCLMDISPKLRTEVQREAMKFAIEWKSTTLVKTENPIEMLCLLHVLAAFSLAYTFDADKVRDLFDTTFLGKYTLSLCEALGVSALASVTNEQQPPEAPINSCSGSLDVQEMATISQLANEDILRDRDVSASFSPNEVSTELPLIKDPGKFVLNSVKDALTGAHQRGELGLPEPVVKTLLPFLEELTRVMYSIDRDLQLDAAKVAQRWSKMMGTGGQLVPFEALGFLQFIVTYGLVDQTKQNETLLFALCIAHFKQAPKLFQSLGLSSAIPNLVKDLLDTRRYIPAVRFMVFFNMNTSCSPLLLLMEEISNLRQSAKENRNFESQDEDRDAEKLREIIEIIEDLKLEIDLPVDLIVKFMVPRKTPNQSQGVVSSSVPVQPPPVHMQASHTVIHTSYISSTGGLKQSYPTSQPNQQVLDVETSQAVGQCFHHAGIKRPRVDSRCPRSMIRPCFDPSGGGRF